MCLVYGDGEAQRRPNLGLPPHRCLGFHNSRKWSRLQLIDPSEVQASGAEEANSGIFPLRR